MVNSILKKAVAQKLNRNADKPGKYHSISGIEHIERLIDIDQSPIGRTPRSNPATYTGVFDDIRDLFAQTNEAKIRGYKKVVSLLMSKVVVVRLVQVMGLSKSKCTFCQMFMCLVRFATADGIILRRLMCITKEKISQKSLI